MYIGRAYMHCHSIAYTRSFFIDLAILDTLLHIHRESMDVLPGHCMQYIILEAVGGNVAHTQGEHACVTRA